MIIWYNPDESKHQAQCPPATHLMIKRKPADEISLKLRFEAKLHQGKKLKKKKHQRKSWRQFSLALIVVCCCYWRNQLQILAQHC